MKKILSILCLLSLCAMLLLGCSPAGQEGGTEEPAGSLPAGESSSAPGQSREEAPAEGIDVRIAALKGPTAMGLVHFMDQAESGALEENTYSFSVSALVDEVNPKLAKGELDIAALPANVASVLYNNNNAGFQVLAINTLGVIYIVESGESLQTVEDLRGKTIYATGKGTTPEYALNYILSGNGIDPAADLHIEWKSEPTECLSALISQENAIAMLPQPFVTTAQSKSDKIRVALDLTQEWEALQEGSDSPSALLTGVVLARREFVEQNPEAVSAFLAHYRDSVDYVNSNPEEGARLVEKYGIVTAEIAEKAIPACNITFIEGEEMKEKLSGYLAALLEQNPQSIGGALPGADFYFIR
ncbi:MAG: ABC transporter substrate-binding protein [Bacillota bacterium]|nr:ABC transporter substrate-binding protein [Bacillota bacterium]